MAPESQWQQARGLLFLAALLFLVVRPLGAHWSAKAECERNGGQWASGACDYGPEGGVVRLLRKSADCRTSGDSRECFYSADTLRLAIAGVGTPTAAIAVDGADERRGYGVGVFTGQGCIRVAPGTELKEREPMRRIEDGFVSTWTGEVYGSMVGCLTAGFGIRRTAESQSAP